jgi:hypothetical protein
MGQCNDVVDAAQETLVLAFQVADKTLLDAPQILQRILDDSEITNAIKKAAESQAKSWLDKQRAGKPIRSDDVKSGMESIARAAGAAAQKATISQLEQSAKRTREHQRLEQSIKQLECSWRKSALGVFVDKHKGLLIIVGSGLALGGAVAMYQFKAGDEIAGPATDLLKKLVKFSVLGNVEISTGKIVFQPAERIVGTTLVATANWKRVKLKFEAGVRFQDVKLTQATGKAEVSIKVFKDLTATVHGSYQYQPGSPTPQQPVNLHLYDLGIGVSYDNAFGMSKVTINTVMFGTQDAITTKVGGKATVGVTLVGGAAKTSPSLKIEAGAAANRILDSLPPPPGRVAGPQNEWNVTLGITGHF